MHIPEAYHVIERLEAQLGDPNDREQVLSFKRAVELDERDEYPRDGCAVLDRAGINDYYIPVTDGGRLASFDVLAAIARTVGRRDLTVAIAHHKTFLAAVHVWVAGSTAQRQRTALYIRSGGRMALGYHEKEHGSDFQATETVAQAIESGEYVLDGEKWFVNNATVGDVQTIFARTNERGGPRGFSLFLVDKRALDRDMYAHLPKLMTHGARGVDFSGIRFTKARLAADCLIGSQGGGVELTLRSFQITRAVVPAISLGAADTALRAVLEFALQRRLYGTTVFALARPRATIVDAFVDLLACDCVVIATARALHIVPEELRLWSAVTKFFVPATVGAMLDDLGEVLGARAYLREGYKFGIFQKIVRDHGAVPMFHAGGFLLLQTVGLSIPQLNTFRRSASPEARDAILDVLDTIFAWRHPLPPFEPDRLVPYGRFRDLLFAVERLSEQLEDGDVQTGLEPSVAGALAASFAALRTAVTHQGRDLDEHRARFGPSSSDKPEFFAICERYCVLHAAVVCAYTWARNRQDMDPAFGGGHWLVLCLQRLLQRVGIHQPVPDGIRDHVAELLVRLHRESRSFSVIPWRLAEPTSS
ncbi:acyl-CoA dehydrogenase [Pendulispora albinea]|uniref:Acyl-CoA dehydrogenase n=1 Tax=Pendulispora albinea TaxID=2741071 RepID=A0ABZ2LZY5_9BACT